MCACGCMWEHGCVYMSVERVGLPMDAHGHRLLGSPPGLCVQWHQARREARTQFSCPRPSTWPLKLNFSLPFVFCSPSPNSGTKWRLFQCGLKLPFMFLSPVPSWFLICFWPWAHICPSLFGPFAEGIPSYFIKLFTHLSLWVWHSRKKTKQNPNTTERGVRRQTLLLISSKMWANTYFPWAPISSSIKWGDCLS